MRALSAEQARWAYDQWYIYGYNWKDIAAKLYVNRSTVTRAVDKYGYDRSKRRPIGNPPDIKYKHGGYIL